MKNVQHFQFWRIWTDGWGPRDWARWTWREALPMWVAWHLPHKVALWAFIRVYAKDGQSPGPEYSRVYDAWEKP
jgi:hypothetical protein